MRSLTFPKAWGNFNPPPNLSLFALSMATHSELSTAGLTDRKGPARVNTRHRYQSYWMRNGFHPGTQHWPSQTFALHKEKINLHEPGRREEVKGGLGREGGRWCGGESQREGGKSSSRRRQWRRQMTGGVRCESERSRWWSMGGRGRTRGCRMQKGKDKTERGPLPWPAVSWWMMMRVGMRKKSQLSGRGKVGTQGRDTRLIISWTLNKNELILSITFAKINK